MSPTNADLAQQITSLISRWDTYTRQLRDWLAGTPDGGPYGDGRYPLQNSLGQVFYVPCPAAQSAMVEGNAASAESFATQAAAHALAAAGAKVAAETARDLALSYRDAAQAAKALAEYASSEAQNAEANARYWAEQAQGSAEGIDAVASEIADTADAVAADRVAAEAARVAAEAAQVAAELAAQQAATFDPANYAPVDHTHSAAAITSGTLSDARLPTSMGGKAFTGPTAVEIGATKKGVRVWVSYPSQYAYLDFHSSNTAYNDADARISAVGAGPDGTLFGAGLVYQAASHFFNVTPTFPTAAAGDNSTKGATTAFVQRELSGKANSNHTHTIADVSGLQAALDGKAAVTHTHGIAQITGLQAALDGKANASHTHEITQVVGLQEALDGKQPAGSYAAASHTHTIADVSGLQTALDGKAANSHTHTIAQITGLQAALDGKAASSHTHTIADVSGLQSELNGRMRWVGQVNGGVYSDHVAQSSAAALFHSSAGAPADAPVTSQASVLHLGNSWGRAQVFFPNSGTNRMFVRTGTRTEWAEVLTTANSPRIFVQATDPGTAASDGDLWVW